MSLAATPTRLPLWQRMFFALPIIGWIAKDLLFGHKNNVWFALIGFVSLWLSSALIFGLPGLYLPALALVPIIFVTLLFITWA
ncbi:hypothetical protein [Roseobacter sp. OBYS 0001]|uniref:hypothetical protein n=1 Tax=Roseobacter sp. OBYS 0001 TaxID=882651 RepID=UPI001BC39768|nr:hypothetical protein [Roseobacter sp. OBYS 0001]GIT85010.1 hypothetical protein ROBYS_00260 [Roseobacter sp. OBYS 0001]